MTKGSDIRFLAAGDTWGISGPTFLKVFLVLACIATIWTFVLRSRIFRGESSGKLTDTSTPPTPMEIAFLRSTSGPTLVAIATLYNMGIIDSNGYQVRTLTPADHLDRVTLRVLSDLRIYRADPVPIQHPLNKPNSTIGDQVRARGWMFTEQDRLALRWALWPLGLVAAFGTLRVIAGIANGKSVGLLLLLIALLIIPAASALHVPRLTPAGQKVLSQYQEQYSYLQPHNRPSLTTYGPEAVLFSAALFGAGALMFYEPAFAAADIVSATEAHRASNGFWSSGSSGSCGSGGGSSCGGGGGCGGGGCGG